MAPKREVMIDDVPSSDIGSHGGRGRGRGRGQGKGRGGQIARQSLSPDSSPPFSPEKVEFLLEVLCTRRRWVRLPNSFAHVTMVPSLQGYGSVLRNARTDQSGWLPPFLRMVPCI